MTSKELYAKADALDADVKELRKRAHDAHIAEQREIPLATRMIYAAYSRCPCGAGLAYDPIAENATGPFKGPLSGYWDCSRIMLGCADPSVKHTDKLPFAFYEIKSEQQASVGGATTRPA